MTKDQLQQLFNDSGVPALDFTGPCHGCGTEITVTAAMEPDGKLTISGGAVYQPDERLFVKCDVCFNRDAELKRWRPVEVYSRVVGYMRPVAGYNPGKKAEFEMRVNFKGVG